MKKINFWSLFDIMIVTILCVGFVSCGDDDEDELVNMDSKTVYVGSKTSIDGARSVVSDNKFVALVSDDNSIEGWHVGKTTVTVNGKYKLPITVRGLYHFYDDPITNWGCSQSYVKQNQKQGTLNSKSDSKMLIYDNVGSATLLAYCFDEGKLFSIMTYVKTSYSSNFINYLTERYLVFPEEVASYSYLGIDGVDFDNFNTAVMITVESTTYISALYASKDYVDSKSSKVKMFSPLNELNFDMENIIPE